MLNRIKAAWTVLRGRGVVYGRHLHGLHFASPKPDVLVVNNTFAPR